MGILNWFSQKANNTMPNQAANTGIALSGGSARGFAHIGVLKALNESNIYPDIISGTSMGSLVGVLYAAGKTPEEIQSLVKESPVIKMVKLAWGKNGMFEMDNIRKMLETEIGTDNFSALKKPFFVSVSNINKGKHEVISSGSLYNYVLASCSVPVVFAPMLINGQTYIDGGLYDNLPAGSLRKHCKTLIGVHVNHLGIKKDFKGIKEVAERSFSLAIGENVKASMAQCDFIIDPPEMQNFSFWDFDKVDEIVETGYRFTKDLISKGYFSNLQS